MKYGRYGWPNFFLRWGLGLTFLGIGVDIFWHPDIWIGYVPESLPFINLSREATLQIGGVFDLTVGTLLIMNAWLKLTSFLAVIHLVGIIILNGIDAVLIRNIGLLGMGLALMFWPTHYHKKKGGWWSKKSKKSYAEEE